MTALYRALTAGLSCLLITMFSGCSGGSSEPSPEPADTARTGVAASAPTPTASNLTALLGIGAPIAAADVNPNALRNCGNEWERVCSSSDLDPWNDVCDTGLSPRLRTCGCLVHGPFGGCLIPEPCRICENDTRRRLTMNAFEDSWADWALRNQRENLAYDEPINWVTHLGTHNAFATVSDGLNYEPLDPVSNLATAPNHFYSMTDQLRTGSRVLALDLHWVDQHARLCHGGIVSIGEEGPDFQLCVIPQRSGTIYPAMRYYANGIKEIRNWLEDNPNEIVLISLENYVGGCNGCFGDSTFGTSPLEAYLGTMIFSPRQLSDDESWPSRRELLAMDKRVIVIDDPVRDGALEFGQDDYVAGGFGTWFASRQNYSECKGVQPATSESGAVEAGPAIADRRQFSVVAEDRTVSAPITQVGSLSDDDVLSAANCNYSIIFFDFYSSNLPLGRQLNIRDFSRQTAAVWSWKEDDRGQNGSCAKLEAASGRWVSANCAAAHRFTCGLRRSESGTDTSTWQPLERDWKVTAAEGRWADGHAFCGSEYPGYVFSVPVNGYQNEALKKVSGSNDVWLHYTDQASDGDWRIPRLFALNSPPIANAGPDQLVECGHEVTLDGSDSVDEDGDTLTYTWTGPFGTLTGAVVKAPMPAGKHAVTLTVNDGNGNSDRDIVDIEVSDTTPPTIGVELSPSSMWSPNHQLVNVTANVHVDDTCGAEFVIITLTSASCDEPENGRGDGNTAPDIEGAEIGSGDILFGVRAERAGNGAGRTCTATYEAVDGAGNAAEASASVTIGHDRGTE